MPYHLTPAEILRRGFELSLSFPSCPVDIQGRLLIAAEEAREIDAKAAILAQASISQREREKLWVSPEAPQSP